MSCSMLLLMLLHGFWQLQAAPAGSGERVHIKVHMPEVVRQHTHFHKVYKHMHHPLPLHASPPYRLKKAPGKPHVSLLGYTTGASGAGGMAPSLMQLMATAATPMSPMASMASMAPTLTPNYGPALFDNVNLATPLQQSAPNLETALLSATAAAKTAPSQRPKPSSAAKQRQQLLQQIFTPNIMAAITASQGNDADANSSAEEFAGALPQEEEEAQSSNADFLGTLQREYLDKFGGGQQLNKRRRRKKYGRQGIGEQSMRRPHYNHNNYLYDMVQDEEADDYAAPYGNFYRSQAAPYEAAEDDGDEDLDEGEDVDSYLLPDSAVAFSDQRNNAFMPSVDEFLEDVSSSARTPTASIYGNMNDAYSLTGEAPSGNANMWQPTASADGDASYTQQLISRPTPTTPTTSAVGSRQRQRQRQRRLPPQRYKDGGQHGGHSGAGKLRFVKTLTRKKRKNRIKSKRYRV